MKIAESSTTLEEQRKTYNRRKMPSSIRLLEEEIMLLRGAMERMYDEEETFQSDLVIDLSQRLDVKINEYMHYYRYSFQ
ncbi:aspartyl-phosphate phosphatase Spo0E family protein [Paenibacillus kobensis]|uniref:aspartyl-phosphate phosphatase Spo0E family protein n=1 Tax=Paenibacillus kobensis TaxID=59841 RepID=UPI001FECA4D5|nr:aspartyl-phosphate phosphatase Spo0E family protein [Paenibacillus kobensis]